MRRKRTLSNAWNGCSRMRMTAKRRASDYEQRTRIETVPYESYRLENCLLTGQIRKNQKLERKLTLLRKRIRRRD